MEGKKTIKLKCKNCDNEWEYSGTQLYYATCTKCLRKVKVGNGKNSILPKL